MLPHSAVLSDLAKHVKDVMERLDPHGDEISQGKALLLLCDDWTANSSYYAGYGLNADCERRAYVAIGLMTKWLVANTFDRC